MSDLSAPSLTLVPLDMDTLGPRPRAGELAPPAPVAARTSPPEPVAARAEGDLG